MSPSNESRSETAPVSPWFAVHDGRTQVGDLILLLTADLKRYVIKLTPDGTLHTHRGMYRHAEIIGRSYGSAILSQTGNEALILEPSLPDIIGHLRRGTQIIYPKDAAYIVHRLNLRAGSRVVEAGTGSGGLTTALAWAVAPAGRVYTYEIREDNFRLARNNLERAGMLPYVDLHLQGIKDGFLQEDADALFLDVRDPGEFMPQVRAALRPGGFFAGLVPTTNQVSDLLIALEGAGFADISVEELLLRQYKPAPERLRPQDEMVAHTGYLVFARMIQATLDPRQWISKERRRYQARLQAQERIAEAEAERKAREAAGGRKYPPLPLPG
jgi:tRNA (adenine57-N1/adenine58-N1)-methyltransferase